MCPNYWTEDQGLPTYDELGARAITAVIKQKANGISSLFSPAVPSNGAALVAAYIAAAPATTNLTEAKKRTGN
jgi:hypothetical protein